MGVRAALACAAAVLVTAAAASGGSVIATPISSDPYTNASSQHRTQVEPDTFGYGDTVVATFQTGRFFDGGGSSNIGWATTTNGGQDLDDRLAAGHDRLPGQARGRGSATRRWRTTPCHDVWMISTLAFGIGSALRLAHRILVSRSTDGGLTWQQPVATFVGGFLDKNWIVCDNMAASPFYGNCYTEWDDTGDGNRQHDRSTDGGLTWGAPVAPAGATGLGGQPVVQPNGTVIVPVRRRVERQIRAFRSIDGGASWTQPCRSPRHATTPWPAACGPSAAVGRDRCRRQGLRRLAGLPVPHRLRARTTSS